MTNQQKAGMPVEVTRFKELRKKMLRWHYDKARTIHIVDLLSSDYQSFRYRVQNRLDRGQVDYRDAIKEATMEELEFLQATIDEIRMEKRLNKRR